MKKLISFEISSSFGFFKKSDLNSSGKFYLTYNTIPKPTLLGVLGASLGLGGYSQQNKEYPEFYEKLNHLQIGIEPLSKNGSFLKRFVEYNNTVGYANKDGVLQIKEQTLIDPKYRIYLLLDLEIELEKELFQNLKNGEFEYIPYMGKNEFPIELNNFKELEFSEFDYSQNRTIKTLFPAIENISPAIFTEEDDFFNGVVNEFFYLFENLPFEFDELLQYRSRKFTFSNGIFEDFSKFRDLNLYDTEEGLICLF